MTVTVDCAALGRTIDDLCQRIFALRKANRQRRVFIAMAGVPGSGKSTISNALLGALQHNGVRNVAVIPMDGFHLSKAELANLADPGEALRRRGAPFTFDAAAFVQAVAALHDLPWTGRDDEAVAMQWPSFDHTIQDPIQDDISILSSLEVVVIEGNYVLLDESPWDEIAELVDERWFIDVPDSQARQRLARRHLQSGIEDTLEAAFRRADDNDLPNGALIRKKLITPDIIIDN